MRTSDRKRRPPPPTPLQEAEQKLQDAKHAYELAKHSASHVERQLQNLHDSASPAHNTLGTSLPTGWKPYTPPQHTLVALDVEVDGKTLDPASERSFKETLLWNLADEQLTPDAFAAISCAELELPPHFAEAIVKAMRRGIQDAERQRKSADKEQQQQQDEARPPEDISLTAESRGLVLTDRLLWPAELSPEVYAATLHDDLQLPLDLCAAAALRLRQELQERMLDDAEDMGVDAESAGVVRAESEQPAWAPAITSRHPEKRSPQRV